MLPLHVSGRTQLCRDLQLVSDYGRTLLLGSQDETRLSYARLLYRVDLFHCDGLHRNLWKSERCVVYCIDGGSWLRKDFDEGGNRSNSLGNQHLVRHHKYRRNESGWSHEFVQHLVDVRRHFCPGCHTVSQIAGQELCKLCIHGL